MSIFWWVVLVIFFINYCRFIDYVSEKMYWNYIKENRNITLLSKIVFPSPSIITGCRNIGFMLKSNLFNDNCEYKEFTSFSKHWQNYLKYHSWFGGIAGVILFFVLMYVSIIIEWLYFILWQSFIKLVIWEAFIKMLIWEMMIKEFIWDGLIKGFIWGVLLSGNWLKKLK
jgi:hypothetical protein